MTCLIIGGPTYGKATREKETGHRNYIAEFIVESGPLDGPANVLQTPGLPVFGSVWISNDDVDLWAWFGWQVDVEPAATDDKPHLWKVTCYASTKPPEKTCKTFQIEDPLLEPPKISGSFVKYTEEATHDRFGNPIVNSAFEVFRGPQVEFDKNRSSIVIEQNVPTALQGYILPAQMIDHVNAYPIWGLPARCVKLSSSPWTRKFYGICFPYYTRTCTLDVNIHIDQDTGALTSGFDRELLDSGTKVLNGHWGVVSGGGCTLTITVGVAGVITGASIGAAGSGYPANTTVSLNVTAGGGQGGVVSVNIDATGAAASVASVVQGGSGYTAGTDATTINTRQWVLDNINGLPPNPSNPQHFIRYTDPNGNPTTVILNGAGLPANAAANEGQYYVSIQAGNSGNSLQNPTWWVELAQPPDLLAWNPVNQYEPGQLVIDPTDGHTYICQGENTGNQPSQFPGIWAFLVASGLPNNQGNYAAATSYNLGDYVLNSGGAGMIFVEKYDEADFLELGFPTSF